MSDVYGAQGDGQNIPRVFITPQTPQAPQTPLQPDPTLDLLMADADANMQRYMSAIAQIESGGKYDMLGPKTAKGDRAYGKYQVMGRNIPEWTQEALGRKLSPEEFLANPEAQDTVFRHRFGSYVRQFGNPADAASAWFTGRPQTAASSAARDVLGTTGKSYVDKFLAALEGGQAGGPAAANALQTGGSAGKQASLVDQLMQYRRPQTAAAGFGPVADLPQNKSQEFPAMRTSTVAPLPMAERALAVLNGDLRYVAGPVAYAVGSDGKQRKLIPVNYNPFEGVENG